MKKKLLAGLLVCAFAVFGYTADVMAFDDGNDTMETATEITMGETVKGESELALDSSGSKDSYDHDYYRFTLKKEQWINCSITPGYDGLSYTLTDETGLDVIKEAWAIYEGDTESITEKLPAGTYYLDVVPTWPNRSGSYKVELSTKGIKFNGVPWMVELSANTKRTKLTLTWDKVDGADGYVIYQYNKKTKKYKKVKTTTKTKAVFTKLKIETEYSYAVSAYIKTGGGKKAEGEKSDVRSIWTNPKKPGSTKITGITIGDRTTVDGSPARAVTLKWNKASNATGYYVYCKLGSGEYELIETTSTNEVSGYLGVGFSYNFYVVPYRTVNGYTTKGDKSAVYTSPKVNN